MLRAQVLSRVSETEAAAASVVVRVNAERAVLLGWSRAILMQLAHPLLAAGVSEHSQFNLGPIATAARLRHTIHAMLALTFGDPQVRARGISRILAIHRRVNGSLAEAAGPFPAGTRYSAEDPELVLWAHAALTESIPLAYEHFVAPLSDADRDAYCADAASIAIELGARSDEVPRSWAGLMRYLDGAYGSGRIVVSGCARGLASAVLAPRMGALVWPLVHVNRLFTAGSLSPFLRAQYGLAWSTRDARELSAIARTARAVRRLTPDVLAVWSGGRPS